MTGSTLYTCPIDECPWNHSVPALDVPEHATPEDLAALGATHTRATEQAMVEHFNSHSGVEWANQVARLHQVLTERPQQLCIGCYLDRHNAQRAGQPLPPQGMVQLIVNGDGRCLRHVALQDGPVMEGRTQSGFILPPGAVPPNPLTN